MVAPESAGESMHTFPDPSAVDFEHVCLSTEEPEATQPNFMPAAVAAELHQAAARLDRRLAIFDRSYLKVRVTRQSAPVQQYWLKLAFLDPRPARVVSRAWWRITGAAALLSGILVLWQPGPSPAAAWIAASAAIAATLLSLAVALRRSCDRLVYYTRHGRVPVLELLRHEPDRRRFGRFLAMLDQAIHRASADLPGERARLLRDEMHEHRRLLEQGVLQPREFDEARARILRAHG
jgi:hypothetical protein